MPAVLYRYLPFVRHRHTQQFGIVASTKFHTWCVQHNLWIRLISVSTTHVVLQLLAFQQLILKANMTYKLKICTTNARMADINLLAQELITSAWTIGGDFWKLCNFTFPSYPPSSPSPFLSSLIPPLSPVMTTMHRECLISQSGAQLPNDGAFSCQRNFSTWSRNNYQQVGPLPQTASAHLTSLQCDRQSESRHVIVVCAFDHRYVQRVPSGEWNAQ